MSNDDTHPSRPSESNVLAAAGAPPRRNGHKRTSPRPPDRVSDGSPRRRSPRDAAESTFFRRYAAEAALVERAAGFDSLLAALEARPDTEGPLEACRALAEAPEARRLTSSPDDVQIVELLANHPSLSGHFFWRAQAAIRRIAVEFGRRMGVAHTDLRPQLLAASVIAALNAAFVTSLSDPAGPPANELVRQALTHMADGLDWPATGSGRGGDPEGDDRGGRLDVAGAR